MKMEEENLEHRILNLIEKTLQAKLEEKITLLFTQRLDELENKLKTLIDYKAETYIQLKQKVDYKDLEKIVLQTTTFKEQADTITKAFFSQKELETKDLLEQELKVISEVCKQNTNKILANEIETQNKLLELEYQLQSNTFNLKNEIQINYSKIDIMDKEIGELINNAKMQNEMIGELKESDESLKRRIEFMQTILDKKISLNNEIEQQRIEQQELMRETKDATDKMYEIYYRTQEEFNTAKSFIRSEYNRIADKTQYLLQECQNMYDTNKELQLNLNRLKLAYTNILDSLSTENTEVVKDVAELGNKIIHPRQRLSTLTPVNRMIPLKLKCQRLSSIRSRKKKVNTKELWDSADLGSSGSRNRGRTSLFLKKSTKIPSRLLFSKLKRYIE